MRRATVKRRVARALRPIASGWKRPTPLEPLVTLHDEYGDGGRAAPVLFVGDSVGFAVSRYDEDTRPLGQMVADKLAESGVPCAWLAYTAYNPSMLELLLGTLDRMPHRPARLILPVNLRSFSPQWMLHPAYRMTPHRGALEKYSGGEARKIRVRTPTPSFRQMQAFEATKVSNPMSPFETVAQFHAVREAKPSTQEQRDYRLRTLFIFHYTFDLAADNPELQALDRLLRSTVRSGVEVCLYLTPINCQRAVELLGTEFSDRVASNVDVVMSTAAAAGVSRRLDLSCLLTPDHFFHRNDPAEHLNQEGRRLLTARIAGLVSGELGVEAPTPRVLR